MHGVLSQWISDSGFASDFLHRGTEGDGLLTGYVQAGTCVYEFWLRLRGEWSDMFGTVVYHMLTPEASAMIAASDMAHTFAVIDSGAFDRMLAASRQMSDVAVVDSVGGTLDGDGCHLTLVTSASTLQRDDWYASLLPEKWCFCRTLRLQFDSKEWNNASVVVAESLGEDDEWSSDAPLAPADATAAADADASGKAFPAAGASGVALVAPSAVHEAGGPDNDEHKGMEGGDDGSGGWLAMATGDSEAPSDSAHNRRVHAERNAPSHDLAADGQRLGGGSSSGGGSWDESDAESLDEGNTSSSAPVHSPAASSDGDREAGGAPTLEHGTQPLARRITPGSSRSMVSSHGGNAMSFSGSQMGDMEAAIASALGGEWAGAGDPQRDSPQLQMSQMSDSFDNDDM